MAHATVQPGAQLSLPWQPDYNALVYVLSGNGTVGAPARPIQGGQLAVLGAGDRITLAASTRQDSNRPTLEVILLGGRPIGEPVAHYGPFVMNTKAELIQAIEDYQAGRLGVIPDNALMPHTAN
jgi:redox-sensitive bicupin YhaK (pirin superfamily)